MTIQLTEPLSTTTENKPAAKPKSDPAFDSVPAGFYDMDTGLSDLDDKSAKKKAVDDGDFDVEFTPI